ncbi:ABC transporter substrate-binding protein [Paraburkholderia oxyphila]|uniref:ABC transporter substrate-binding protein n=1 Tax=Paraburkholderia oxyphila TaxID=614212 RepID=UPI000AB4B9AB|nr:ABC transporter substrate-binding protein [Paraburkholderia oxyphila]
MNHIFMYEFEPVRFSGIKGVLKMKAISFSLCAALGLVAWAPVSYAGSCGHVTIASMNWQSAEVLAAVDKIILNQGYGCDAEVSTGDTVPTITSMVEKGQPDIAPEVWTDNVPDVVKRGLAEGKLQQTAKVISDGGMNGWFIPKYVADKHPEIKTIADVLKHPELFPAPDDPKKGAIYNGPQGWGWTVITAQLFKAFKADKDNFELVDTGSAAGLDSAIAKAYQHKQGLVAYYWSPTALLGKYPMVRLDPGVPFNEAEWRRCTTKANCPDPKPTGWQTSDPVYTFVTKRFASATSPDVMQYLNTRAWSNATVNQLMAWMTANQATGEDGAKHFLKDNKNVWTKWVSKDAADRINASL